MKKILSTGLFALGLLALGQQPASAWTNSKFSVGLNWHIQSGNNNILWGLWKNGQVPGPEAFGGGHGGFAPAPSFHAPMPSHAYAAPGYSAPAYGMAQAYASPFQFANYVRPSDAYYYPTPSYYYPMPSYYYPQSSFYYYGE